MALGYRKTVWSQCYFTENPELELQKVKGELSAPASGSIPSLHAGIFATCFANRTARRDAQSCKHFLLPHAFHQRKYCARVLLWAKSSSISPQRLRCLHIHLSCFTRSERSPEEELQKSPLSHPSLLSLFRCCPSLTTGFIFIPQ